MVFITVPPALWQSAVCALCCMCVRVCVCVCGSAYITIVRSSTYPTREFHKNIWEATVIYQVYRVYVLAVSNLRVLRTDFVEAGHANSAAVYLALWIINMLTFYFFHSKWEEVSVYVFRFILWQQDVTPQLHRIFSDDSCQSLLPLKHWLSEKKKKTRHSDLLNLCCDATSECIIAVVLIL